jgi:hypothetical protein
MDILLSLRPKNMTVVETAWITNSNIQVTTYIFNGKEYTHVGSWPPRHASGSFHVPIHYAFIIDTGEDITHQLKRFAGPQNIVTQQTMSYAFGTWSWRVYMPKFFRLETYPIFRFPDTFPPVCVIDILGHASVIRCAR